MRTYVTLIIFLSILLVIFTNYTSITYYSSLPSLNPSLNSLQTVPQINTESKKSSTLLTVSNPNLSTVTYTISLTSCSSSPTLKHDSSLIGLIDGSLILRHSILTHSPTPPNFIAFIHTTAKDTPCHLELERGGWECKVVDTPLKVSDIKTDNIRRNIEKNGCCGDKELIKLYAYTLTTSDVVIMLDLDVLLLRPLTSLINSISISPEGTASYTEDWGMVNPGKKPGAQGGFIVIKPSLRVFNELIDIVLNTPFNEKNLPGWNGSGIGPFWGAMTVQGLIPYYYQEVKGAAVEVLNRCMYNNMRDNPKVKNGEECRGPVKGVMECEDCREKKVEDIYSTHFTLCQKPWGCQLNGKPWCTVLHDEWFYTREKMEVAVLGGDFTGKGMRGYCKKGGKEGYERVSDDVRSMINK
ncbi:hypothetical protein TrLO_g12475 [Triparma laevis f. longispina]|uniref:Uncharacterized protein n=1 Tax=Triparma laevis f. longispina TaxID=1714387 RepID=A0A9W7FS47_9STRA|nr:hypothetical protein TrLO_g12475 [Triparma laevis f. longispina]